MSLDSESVFQLSSTRGWESVQLTLPTNELAEDTICCSLTMSSQFWRRHGDKFDELVQDSSMTFHQVNVSVVALAALGEALAQWDESEPSLTPGVDIGTGPQSLFFGSTERDSIMNPWQAPIKVSYSNDGPTSATQVLVVDSTVVSGAAEAIQSFLLSR